MTEKKWLCTIEALDASNNPVTLRFSSGGYIDSSANYYDDRIQQAALFSNALFAGSLYNAIAKPGFGETTLVNNDGALDYLADYAIDGRQCTISLVQGTVITPVLTATTTGFNFNANTVSVRLKDYQVQTDKVHVYSEYLGDNTLPDGLEGTSSDIKGNKKPRVYGAVQNMQPTLVNTARYIYEAHDDSINPAIGVEITSVYDRGVELTKHTHYTDLATFMTDSVPSGHYITYKGYFKLGSTPSGEVTCDVERDVTDAPSVIEQILGEVGLLYDNTSKAVFPAYNVGFVLTGAETTSQILEKLCNGCGYFWYFDGNVVKTDKFANPTSPVISLDDNDIIEISRSSLGAGSNGLPYKKVVVKGDKVETVQTDLAASVDAEYKAKVSAEYREAQAENAVTAARHLLAEELEVQSFNRSLTDCQTVASNLLDFFSIRRDSVELTAYISEDIASQIGIAKVVQVQSRKLGYSLGKTFVIVGFTLDAKRNRVQLKLLG